MARGGSFRDVLGKILGQVDLDDHAAHAIQQMDSDYDKNAIEVLLVQTLGKPCSNSKLGGRLRTLYHNVLCSENVNTQIQNLVGLNFDGLVGLLRVLTTKVCARITSSPVVQQTLPHVPL